MCCISTRSIFIARSFHLPKGNFRIIQTLFFSFDLMCWCWQTDPVERPSFQTIYRFLTVTHKVWLVLAFSWYSYTISSQLINEYSLRATLSVQVTFWFQKFQTDESLSNEQCNEDKSSPRYCSKVFNEEENSPLMLIDEICRGGMWHRTWNIETVLYYVSCIRKKMVFFYQSKFASILWQELDCVVLRIVPERLPVLMRRRNGKRVGL